MDLTGRTAIVTGASQGIGRGISHVLSIYGAITVLVSRNEERLRAVENEIVKAGRTAFSVRTDVRDVNECKRMVEKVLSDCGRVDILINNAGRGLGGEGLIELSDPDEVTDLVRLNLLGVYNCTYCVLPFMKAQRDGHIVNISSVAGLKSFPLSPMYSATKAAIKAFGEGLRTQVRDYNIRVTTIYPGMTDTPMLERFSKEERDNFLKPDHIGELVAHILGYPDSVSVTEAVIKPTWEE